MILRRHLATVLILVTTITAIQLVAANPAGATPPGIPTAATARSELATLTVAAWTHTTTYQRSLFPTWDTISGTCDTRETVLKRDGTNVVVNSACTATSGTWHSPLRRSHMDRRLRCRHRPHGHPQKRVDLRRLGLDHQQT
jgi:hypothetical protein